jgi:hypothetical protein
VEMGSQPGSMGNGRNAKRTRQNARTRSIGSEGGRGCLSLWHGQPQTRSRPSTLRSRAHKSWVPAEQR